MWREMANEPLFGMMATVIVFLLARGLHQKFHLMLFHPALLAPVAIIIFLRGSGIPYEHYAKGADMVSFGLGPATVALGVTLYRQRESIRKAWRPITAGVIAGATAGVLSAAGLAKLMGATSLTVLSLAPKSTTTPIAVAITEKIGGNAALTVATVIMTGILGNIMGPELLRLFRVKRPAAIGIAIGTASHAIGTARAIKEGKVEAAMSSLAIILAGTVTALLTPHLIKLFS